MGTRADGAALDELLSHADWVRRVAARLVHDAAAADDLAQDVWLTVLRDSPSGLERPRAWLASVARTLAFTRGRSDARRSSRELERGGGDTAAAALDVVAEAEREREVARLVLELDEPYRTVLLYRFYRDMPPRRIASELGRPVATVKVQIQRGLERLRSELDQEHGDRATWCALLMPLALRDGGSPLLAGLLAWAGILAASTGLWLVAQPSQSPAEPAGQVARLQAPESPAEELPSAVDGLISRELRAEVPVLDVLQEDEPGARKVSTTRFGPTSLEPLHLRVSALDGEPLVGVRVLARDPGRLSLDARGTIVSNEVWLPVPAEVRDPAAEGSSLRERFLHENFIDPEEARALLAGRPLLPESGVSDRDGLLTLEVSVPWVDLQLEDQSLTVLGWGPPRERLGMEDRVLFVARTSVLSGRVVDARGTGLAHASVSVHSGCPPELSSMLEMGSGLSSEMTTVETGPDGGFRFASVPQTQMLVVSAEYEGNGSSQILDLSDGEQRSDLRLRVDVPGENERLFLRGTVLAPEGSPVRGASVALGERSTTTDGEGKFEFELGRFEANSDLAVAAPGFAPHLEPGYGAWLVGSAGVQDAGRLQLRDSRMQLAGVVVDRNGQPVVGVPVSLRDPTRIASTGEALEDVAAGRSIGPVETDAQGRFLITGLFPRDYELRVGQRPQSSRHGPLPARQRGARELRLVHDPR